MITLKDITFDETSKNELFYFLQKEPRYCNSRLFKIHFCKLLNDMNSSSFPSEFNDFSFPQKVFHYLQNDYSLELGRCVMCGKRCKFNSISIGYNSHCSVKCSGKDPRPKELMKKTRLKQNGGKYLSDSEIIKRNKTINEKSDDYKQAIKDKRKRTNIEKYGVENAMQCEYIKEKTFNIIKERYGGIGNSSSELKARQEETMKKRYGVRHNWQSKDELLNGQKTRKEIYGNKNYVCTNEFLDYMKSICDERNSKIIETKKKNHTFNSSKIEEQFNEFLLSMNVVFIRQYKDDRYPFSCDFYIPDKDLFIELNGLWTHGGKPFEGSDEDIQKIELWKSKNNDYYNNAIETWTIRDVRKRNYAKRNKLNYIEVFSNDICEIIEELKNIIYENKN